MTIRGAGSIDSTLIETSAPIESPQKRTSGLSILRWTIAKRSAQKYPTVVAGPAVVALVTFCFLLLFWNRFIGLRSGDGGFTGGIYFLKGIMPYRDYYAPVPPLFTLRCAAVLAIFGKLPIAIRAFGVFERVVLSLALYGWLARFFRVKDAAMAALVTIVLSAGDIADPVSSYNHFTILLAVASGWAGSYALDDGRTGRFLVSIGSITGLLSFLCLASKQTIGLGVSIGIPAVVGLCLLRMDGLRKAIRFLIGFAAGWVIAASVLVTSMLRLRIFGPFLKQAFVTGPAAKATHLSDFARHEIIVAASYELPLLIALVVLPICWVAVRRSDSLEKVDSASDAHKGIALILLLGLGAIWASTKVDSRIMSVLSKALAVQPTIYISLLGSGVFILGYFGRFLIDKPSRRQAQFSLFAAISFIVAFMISLSFPAFEAMIIPGLGLVLAALLNYFEGRRRWVVFTTCGVLIFCTALLKQELPFSFDGWDEQPTKVATVKSSLPELRGFLLPPETIEFVDSTIRIIEENSTPEDTIFIYPELGFFYGATGRKPATLSGSHNFDTVPDSFARNEAQRLLRARPAVLIISPMEKTFQADEAFWRNGKPSGQRDLLAAAETLAKEYTLVRTFKSFPNGQTAYVYVRPDRIGIGTKLMKN